MSLRADSVAVGQTGETEVGGHRDGLEISDGGVGVHRVVRCRVDRLGQAEAAKVAPRRRFDPLLRALDVRDDFRDAAGGDGRCFNPEFGVVK